MSNTLTYSQKLPFPTIVSDLDHNISHYWDDILLTVTEKEMSCNERFNYIQSKLYDDKGLNLKIEGDTVDSKYHIRNEWAIVTISFLDIQNDIPQKIEMGYATSLGAPYLNVIYENGVIMEEYFRYETSTYSKFDVDVDKYTYEDFTLVCPREKYYLDFEHFPYDEVTETSKFLYSHNNCGDAKVYVYETLYKAEFEGDIYTKSGKLNHSSYQMESKFGWWEYRKNGDLFLRREFRNIEKTSCDWRKGRFPHDIPINQIWTAMKFPLLKKGDLNYIIVSFGDKEYEFLLDTGASDVLINSEIEKNLLNTGALRTTDYLETVKYKFADGSSKYFKTANLYSVKIGDTSFSNINVAIGDSNSSLLLGMSFLNKFDWKIKGDFLELTEK